MKLINSFNLRIVSIRVLIIVIIILMISLSFLNSSRYIRNYKFLTRFFCDIDIQRCLTYEKPGAGLGLYLTLRRLYSGYDLYMNTNSVISFDHLKRLSNINPILIKRIDIQNEYLEKHIYDNHFIVIKSYSKILLPIDVTIKNEMFAANINVINLKNASMNKELILISYNKEFYILPKSILDIAK